MSGFKLGFGEGVEDKEESLAQGWRSLCGLCQQYLLPHLRVIRWNSASLSLQRTFQEGHMVLLDFPTPLKLTWPCDLFWPMICEETCITSGHTFSDSMALHPPFSYCCHHGNIWGDEVSVWSMPLFRKYFGSQYSHVLWISHLPCDLWNDVIMWFQNDESWAAGFFSSFFWLFFDGGPA